ncbi:MAG: acetyl-CoA decarbonylase/synthase complex subunit gamma [Candidatus Bipolaricaulota bacterium]
MARKLTGIEVYKLLPKTNCGDCNFPTCMAFAMQVAAKKVALEQCPHVSEEAQAALGEAQAPPMRTVQVGRGDRALTIGGETVLFRHEEKFHHQPGVAIRISDALGDEDLARRTEEVQGLRFERVGEEIRVDLVAVHCESGDGERYAQVVKKVKEDTGLPMLLQCSQPEHLSPALEAAGERPLLWAADANNWEEMADLALKHEAPLGVKGETLEELADLTGKLKDKGIQDLVLEAGGEELVDRLTWLAMVRRLALQKEFRPLGYPALAFTSGGEPTEEAAEAIAYVCKYAGVVVMDNTAPEAILSVLTARQNVYTDPQKPNAIEAKLYEIGDVGPDSPVLLTTNFALTYFTVAGEVENSRVPAYITVMDTEGLGVLNAYADDKLTADRVIKTVREQGAMDKANHNKLVIPGLAAMLRMEIQDESGWEVIIGPEDAARLPHFLRNEWRPD